MRRALVKGWNRHFRWLKRLLEDHEALQSEVLEFRDAREEYFELLRRKEAYEGYIEQLENEKDYYRQAMHRAERERQMMESRFEDLRRRYRLAIGRSVPPESYFGKSTERVKRALANLRRVSEEAARRKS